jgi:hypothetical protein
MAKPKHKPKKFTVKSSKLKRVAKTKKIEALEEEVSAYVVSTVYPGTCSNRSIGVGSFRVFEIILEPAYLRLYQARWFNLLSIK